MTIKITGIAKFEADLQTFADRLQIDAKTVVKKVAFEVFEGVTKRTPVDTGWARASWIITTHNPDLSTTAEKAGFKKKGMGEAAAAVANATQVAGTVGSSASVWWITNNVPYIVKLENGHSKQAGRGFMAQRTVADVQANMGVLLGGLS